MKRSAFTMIELIFVIVILGILASVAIPKLAGVQNDALETSERSGIAAFRTGVQGIQGRRIRRGAAIMTIPVDGPQGQAYVVTMNAPGAAAYANDTFSLEGYPYGSGIAALPTAAAGPQVSDRVVLATQMPLIVAVEIENMAQWDTAADATGTSPDATRINGPASTSVPIPANAAEALEIISAQSDWRYDPHNGQILLDINSATLQ